MCALISHGFNQNSSRVRHILWKLLHQCLHMGWWVPIVISSSARFALVYVLILTQTQLGLDWSSLGCSSLGARVLFLLPVLKSSLNSSSRSLASGAPCAIKRWGYWRCCARSTPWCQTLFLLHPLTLPLLFFPPYLAHLESIKELGEEGKNPSTGNVFTMRGKARGTPFKRLKHPCRNFLGPVFVLWWKDSWTTQPEFYSPLYC